MKHAAAPTQPVTALFTALFFAVALFLAGCSASSIAGPDLAPIDEIALLQEAPSSVHPAHNEGQDQDKNGSEHNEQDKKNGSEHNENKNGSERNEN